MSGDRLLVQSVIDPQGCLLIPLFCIGCGNDLKTLPLTGFCPRCERPVRESTNLQLPSIDADGCLLADVPCLNCGYNLRTRRISELCPECAADVAVSIRSDMLRFAPVDWVRRLASGARLLVAAVLGSLMLPVFGIFFGVNAALNGTLPPPRFGFLMGPAMALFVLVLGMLTLSVQRLTTVDPRAPSREWAFSARKLTRLGLLAVGVAYLWSLFTWTPMPGIRGTTYLILSAMPGNLMAGRVSIVATIAGLAFTLPLLCHLADLMKRIPNVRLVTWCKIEFRGLLTCGLLLVAGAPLAVRALASKALAMSTTPRFVTPASSFGSLPMMSSLIFVIGACGLFLLGVAGCILIIRVQRALVAVARAAEENARGVDGVPCEQLQSIHFDNPAYGIATRSSTSSEASQALPIHARPPKMSAATTNRNEGADV